MSPNTDTVQELTDDTQLLHYMSLAKFVAMRRWTLSELGAYPLF